MAVWPPNADDDGFEYEKESDEDGEQWYDQMVD